MNQLIFVVWRGVQHGGMQGPAPYQAGTSGTTSPVTPGVIQMLTLQAIGTDQG